MKLSYFRDLIILVCLSLGSIFGLYLMYSELSKPSVITNRPTDEQRYECRMSGGQLEHFGERGWVCIKPKN